ncbi:hypothetical protein DEM27_10875 [Metarhizobium album]|uniref:Uncharacterized protein n=1 Tax=Metarhizobium album TaxID=2182425 RepID=A0A2U2DRM2_9HYPH|nr:hypothetical protein [Rhizobium album]PWE55948.1 hypothetical protein DEM27_10875 [Rhizobium album]
MRLLLTAAMITAAALALTAPDSPGRFLQALFGHAGSEIRVDADASFHAPTACETRTLDRRETAAGAAKTRVRVCS